jgi:L-histidine N-alpha-methyltransferase
VSSTRPIAGSGRFTLERDPHPARVATFAEDVRTGLGVRPYTLMPKYFYDDVGSALFETITRLPEYYLTRIERDLLATYGAEIVAAFGEPRDHRCDPRAPRRVDVPPDRHFARRAG